MQITHMDHCSVIVTDVARSRQFYRDIMGLKEIGAPRTFDFVALWFDLGGGQTLHLLLRPKSDSISPRHFALHVADAREAREHFRSRGVEVEETVEIPHCDRFFIRDPDGK
jgi:catechol 2,3-dioxygenase-like lactoylglutathione lyase family enzyme